VPPGADDPQRRRLQVALVLLLGAVLVVAIKYRDQLFGSDEESAEATPAAVVSPKPKVVEGAPAPVQKKPAAIAAAVPPTITPSITRAALPPLEVEVVAGGKRQALHPTPPNTVRVDTTTGAPNRAQPGTEQAAEGAMPTPAAERVRLSPEALQVLSHPVDPSYPLLAREMKVQGSVVLRALISKEGTIQDLRVVSGPNILASAAMEAVRQWRFKPYYEKGVPVETEASITVNFTISTS
jgi:protein TonB